MKRFGYLIAVVLLALMTVAFNAASLLKAQEVMALMMVAKPVVYALSADQQKAIATAVQFQQTWRKNFEQAEMAALNAPLKAQEAVEALGNFQKAFAMLEAANSKMEALLSAHRLAHNCAECQYAPDWKALVKPEVKP